MPIFVKELEYKCAENRDQCLVIGRTNVQSCGDQKSGGSIPQPTAESSDQEKIFSGYSSEPNEPIEII